MNAAAFLPSLEIIPEGAEERLLPEAAEDGVEVWAGNGVNAYGYTASGHEWIHLPGVATFRFQLHPSSVVAIPDGDRSVAGVRDAYHRNILPLVLQMCGTEVLHASAVTTGGGVLAICGVSGAGKSTLAYSLSRRGYGVFADDAVALRIDGGPVAALPVPFWLNLRADPSLIPGQPGSGRTTVGGHESDESPLSAILLLEAPEGNDDAPIRLDRLEPSAAFTALLVHAYYYRLSDTERKKMMVGRYLQLASSVQVFNARVRHDFEALPSVLDRIEERVLGAAG